MTGGDQSKKEPSAKLKTVKQERIDSGALPDKAVPGGKQAPNEPANPPGKIPSSLDSSWGAANPPDQLIIRRLFDDYLRMYASRDDRLTTFFSEDFSGFTGGGDSLVKNRAEWVAITRQDFDQVKDPIQIELKDVAIQSLAETIAVATGFFIIHLPMRDQILSRETARLVLIFRKESAGWKISHSSISIPYHLVRKGEVYPMQELVARNQFMEEQVAERTIQLSEANNNLRQTNEKLAREIAEHQQADSALQKSEERYRSILTASPDDITILDGEGRIVMVSPAAFSIFGMDQGANFVGRPVTDYLVPEDRPRALAQIALKRQGLVTGPTEYRGLRPDGSTFDIEVNSEFIRDAEGATTGMVVIVRDVTERKQAALEKEKLETQNQQLQKAESLGRMAGAIAHHFNNQLQAAMMSLELAFGDLSQNAESAGFLTTAMQSLCKAAEVSSLMLTYLGRGDAKRETLDLSAVCHRNLSLLRAVMPRNVVLETALPSPGPSVFANAIQLQQVVTNLVTNAWEASKGDRSAIRLAVTTVSPAEISAAHRFPINCQLKDTAYACVEVADAGCGIVDNDIEKVFDPFFSSKFAGRGMGLAVVLGIARALDGVITVESEKDRGSVFRVFLPLSTEAIAQQVVRTAPTLKTAERGTVLAVEDEPTVRIGVVRALKQFGYTVLEAEDGVAAVEIFRRHQKEIGCVLCDLTMPKMDGWQTLAALRQLEPGIPVILASGYSELQVMGGGHGEQPQAFLHKPYELKELRAAISQFMAIRNGGEPRRGGG